MPEIPYGRIVGTVIDRGGKPNELMIIVSYDQREQAPCLGSFLVVEDARRGRRLLCRIDDEAYGDFQATRDERQRALIEKHIRELRGASGEMTEEEKRTLFFRSYTATVLGILDPTNQRVRTDYRALPELPAACRYPHAEEMDLIMQAATASSGGASEFSFAIGNLAYGEEVYCNHPLHFSPEKLLNRRTAIVARSGYGKSNLCKLLVTSLALGTSAGVLVFDLHGEYALGDVHTGTTAGLLEVFLLTPKTIWYTRPDNQGHLAQLRRRFPAARISPLINLVQLPSHVIRSLCPVQEQETATVRDLRGWIDRERSEWQRYVEQIVQNWNNPKERYRLIEELGEKLGVKQEQQSVFRRLMEHLIPSHNDAAPQDFLSEIQRALRQGDLVIMDLSRYSAAMALRIVNTVLDYLLYLRQARIGVSRNPVVAVLEEAQNFLSKKHVEKDEIAARWAKEGRKYGLGLIYVTQQPGAIAEEILSQTDNFFALHLLSESDVGALKKANPLFAGYEGLLQREPVAGNAYVYVAPSQAYVLPVRLREFTVAEVTSAFRLPSPEESVECIRRVCEAGGYDASDRSAVGRFRLRTHRQLFGEELRLPGIADRWGEYVGFRFPYAERLLKAAPILLGREVAEASEVPQEEASPEPEAFEVYAEEVDTEDADIPDDWEVDESGDDDAPW